MNKDKLHSISHGICRDLRELELEYEIFEQVLNSSNNLLYHCKEGDQKVLPNDRYNHFVQALGSLRECQALLEYSKVHKPDLLQSIAFVENLIYEEIKGIMSSTPQLRK